MRVIVLVDGEHYPPVTRWGIETARERGHDVVGALFVGGSEKLQPGPPPDLGLPTRVAGEDRMAALALAIDEFEPEGVLDLSDDRCSAIGSGWNCGRDARARPSVPGRGFPTGPADRGPAAPGTHAGGDRHREANRKTAISGALARLATRRGLDPVIVAMGFFAGGPRSAGPVGNPRPRYRKASRERHAQKATKTR